MRCLTRLAVFCALATFPACGSTSTETTVGPSPVRCGVSLALSPTTTVPHRGGNGTLQVSAARECSWTATSQASWISLASTSGQGDAAIAFSVAPNPSATTRRGSVVVQGSSADITQEAAPCTFELDRQSFEVPASASTHEIGVQAPGGCSWTASSSAGWMAIVDGAQGSGSGRVRFSVAANAGPTSRTGTLDVAGHRVTVRQLDPGSSPPPPAPGPGECTYGVDPVAAQAGSQEFVGAFSVVTEAGCPWSATSQTSWLTVLGGGTGNGPAQVQYRAAENTSLSSRTGHIDVNGAVFTLAQQGRSPSSCDFEIEPESASFGAGGGNGEIEVDADSGCLWTAVSLNTWIQITSGSAGSGDGDVSYQVHANTGDARTGTIAVAGFNFRINQAAPAPETRTVDGRVSDLSGSCPDTTFDVEGQRVRTNSSTTFRSGNCERHLTDDVRVRVTGTVGSDGVLAASEVRF